MHWKVENCRMIFNIWSLNSRVFDHDKVKPDHPWYVFILFLWKLDFWNTHNYYDWVLLYVILLPLIQILMYVVFFFFFSLLSTGQITFLYTHTHYNLFKWLCWFWSVPVLKDAWVFCLVSCATGTSSALASRWTRSTNWCAYNWSTF